MGTRELMFDSLANTATCRTCLGRVGRIDIFDRDSHGFGFVFNKALKLPESPSMQSGSDTFPSLDAFTNVCEVFKDDYGNATIYGL